MKNIVVLGSTGSVGMNALEIVRKRPDAFRVVGLTADSNYELLLSQVKEFGPKSVCLSNLSSCKAIRPMMPSDVKLYEGEEGLRELAQLPFADLIIAASSGVSALLPVLDAIRADKQVAIANKEILVMAGHIIIEEAKKHHTVLLPVDSEHNAIFQCLESHKEKSAIRKIWLTGSGGPLRDVPVEKFKGMSKEVVLKHPKWVMGKKITIDSATMMNKGLEIIEAKWLFGLEPEQIKVMIHPQAIIHSMVEWCDGSIIAQLGPTDMKLPLIHVMSYPDRVSYPDLSVSLSELRQLEFLEPDESKFECLKLAWDVAHQVDTTLPCVLNAADEVAVEAFLNDKIDFSDIPRVIRETLQVHESIPSPTLEDILQTDDWARKTSLSRCEDLIDSSLVPRPSSHKTG